MRLFFAICLGFVAHGRAFGQPPTWTLKELSRIDGASPLEANHFVSVQTIVVSPAGDVFVPMAKDAQIRMFSEAGKHVATIGRRGSGPGEFRSTSRMGLFGDTLYVIDMSLRRISFFSSTGAFLTSFNFAPQPSLAVAFDMPVAVSRGNAAIAVAEVLPPTPPGSRVSLPIVRTSYEGQAPDTIATVMSVDPLIRAPFSGTTLYRWQPVSDAPLIAVSRDGSKVVIVNRAVANEAKPACGVTSLDATGKRQFSVEISYQPREYSRASFDSIVEAFASAPPKAHRRVDLERDLFRPRWLPPVTAVTVGRNGFLWLERERIGQSRIGCDVLDTTGKLVGRLQLDPGQRILYADDRIVWAVVLDEDDVPSIVRYRIER